MREYLEFVGQLDKSVEEAQVRTNLSASTSMEI